MGQTCQKNAPPSVTVRHSPFCRNHCDHNRTCGKLPARHGLTDPGKCLVTIQPAQLDDFSVELETVVGELGFAKTNGPRNLVQSLSPFHNMTSTVYRFGFARSHSFIELKFVK